jgi:hypothetical protein
MNKLLLSWCISQKGGSQYFPYWEDIYGLLNKLKLSYGSVSIDRLDHENYLISEIQVKMENGFYLVTLLNEDDDVLSLSDPIQSDKKIFILGDSWSISQTTQDFDLVIRIFKEFFETGDVSKEILN